MRENRRKFFERLAFLSGGAVVVSVSLLSTVLGKTVIHGAVFLFSGWACLVIALLASLFREMKYQQYIAERAVAHYMGTVASKKTDLASRAEAGDCVVTADDGPVRQQTAEELATQAAESRSDQEKRKEWAENHFRAVRRFVALFALVASSFRTRAAMQAEKRAGKSVVKRPPLPSLG